MIVIKYIYSPGCSLKKSYPDIAKRAHEYLIKSLGDVEFYNFCCRSGQPIPEGTVMINTCPGCDDTFNKILEASQVDEDTEVTEASFAPQKPKTVTFWDIVVQNGDFPYPQYSKMEITVHDSCPMREKPDTREAIRTILRKMDFKVIEAKHHGDDSMCCGYSIADQLTKEELHLRMKERADALPVETVCVYCTGCMNAMAIGEKNPVHLIELMFKY